MANQIIDVQKIIDRDTLRDGQLFIGEYADDPVENPTSIFTKPDSVQASDQILTPLTLNANGFPIDPATGLLVTPYMNRSYSIVLRDKNGAIAYGPVKVPVTQVDDLGNLTSDILQAAEDAVNSAIGQPDNPYENGYFDLIWLGGSNLQTLIDAKEDDLGNPSIDGQVLSSTIAGVRSWVTQSGFDPTSNQSITGVWDFANDTDLNGFVAGELQFDTGPVIRFSTYPLETTANRVSARVNFGGSPYCIEAVTVDAAETNPVRLTQGITSIPTGAAPPTLHVTTEHQYNNGGISSVTHSFGGTQLFRVLDDGAGNVSTELSTSGTGALSINGSNGASGTFTTITSITVTNGIITAITGS